MTLLNDEAVDLVDGVRAVHRQAHEAVGEQLARGRARLRSTSKTRKSALTRERIMTAASELMAEYGGTDFQMSEVSDRCHMSKGALYYYFADKDELVDAIFADSVDDLIDGIEAVVASAPTARDALRGLCLEFARRVRAGSPVALAMMRELAGAGEIPLTGVPSHFSRATKIIAAQIERAKVEGLVRKDADSDLAAVYATGGFIVTSLVAVNSERYEDKEQLSLDLVEMALAGIGVEGATLTEG